MVILGGGSGGLDVAKKIQKKLTPGDKVVVIDRQNLQYFNPSLLWLLIGERKPAELYRSLDCLPDHGIEFVHDEAVQIKPDEKVIILKNSPPLTYDYLVLATGADYDIHKFSKLNSAGYNLHTIEGMTALRQAINEFTGGQITILVPALPIKCPGATYETAFLINHLLKKKGLQSKTDIQIYTAEDVPLMNLGPTVADFTLQQLKKQKISVYYKKQFEKVNPDRKLLQFADCEVSYDLLIYTPPLRGSMVIQNSKLGDENGWIPTNPSHLTTAYSGILAMGDATNIRLPYGETLIKCGAVATVQSLVVSSNVLAMIRGQKPGKSYGGWTGYVLEIGSGQSVTVLGKCYTQLPPCFFITPISRIWRLGKRLIEYNWLNKARQPV